MKKPIIETEVVGKMTNITIGGYLELKRRIICLRMGDAVERLTSGEYRVTRTWQPPGKQPFDQHIYGAPRSAGDVDVTPLVATGD